MISADIVDLRLHNLLTDLCINIDSPPDRSLSEIGQFLRQQLGASNQDIKFFEGSK